MAGENEIYKFLKENDLTSKDEATFTKEYADPKKAEELHRFFVSNDLTTKDSASFYDTYFKKKDGTAVIPTTSNGSSNGVSPIQSQSNGASNQQPRMFGMETMPKQNGVDNTRIAKPFIAQTEADKKETVRQREQKNEHLQEALTRSTKAVLKSKGINAVEGSPEYNKELEKLGSKVLYGDAVLSYDKEGKPGLKKMTGLFEGAAKGWHETVKGIDEATSFLNMDNKQRIAYANKQQEENPNPEYISEGTTGMGEVGQTLGGVAPIAGKAIAGGIAASALAAAAPATGGISLAGLPAVASIGFTAHDMMALDAQKRVLEAYNYYKQQGLSDDEAMEKANSRYVAGAVEGAAKSVAFESLIGNSGAKMAQPISKESKNLIASAFKNTAKSAGKMGAQFGGLEAATQAEGQLEGVKTTPSAVGETFVNHFIENAKVGALLHGVMHEAPKLGKSVLKAAYFKSGGTVEDAAKILQANAEAGNITPEKAQETVQDLAEFEKAKTQVHQEGMKPEVEASVAGLQQKINNLVERLFMKKVGQENPEIDAEIAATNKQIDEIKKSGNPAASEVEEVSGKTYGELEKENEEKITSFADRIKAGEKMSSPEDLQFYENNKKEIESKLKNKKEVSDATTIWQEPKGNLTEYKDGDGGGETTEAGGSNRNVEGGEIKPIVKETVTKGGEEKTPPTKTEQLTVSEIGLTKDEYEAKKADIDKRRQDKLQEHKLSHYFKKGARDIDSLIEREKKDLARLEETPEKPDFFILIDKAKQWLERYLSDKELIDKINAKYDAELADLEKQQKQSPTVSETKEVQGENVAEGKIKESQPTKTEPTTPKESDSVKVPSPIGDGSEMTMVYHKGEWKQKVGMGTASVSDKVQQQAQEAFDNTTVINETKTTDTTNISKSSTEESIANKGVSKEVGTTGEGKTSEEGKPTSKKQSVLERKSEDVTVDDILGELLGGGIGESDLANKTLKDKDGGIQKYIDAGKKVLKGLYPKAELKAFKTDAEYVAAGGKEGTRGFAIMNKNGEHKILLNLEAIAETNSNKTVFHEIIHPIVYDAFGLKPEELIPIWNDLAKKMQDVPGMESVFEHISEYGESKKAAEGLTEMLTQIAKGNIDLKAVPKSTVNQIIELINKVFEAVGLNFKIKNIDDFAEISKKVKEAFETGETKGLEKVVKRGGIDKTVKELKAADIDPEHRKKLLDLLKQKVESEIKSGKLTEEQAKKIYEKAGIKEEKAEPPKTPPSEPKAEGEAEPKGKPKSLANRLVEAKNVPESAKEGIRKEGLEYEPKSQIEAQKLAKAILEEEGIDSAVLQAQAGKFGGDVNTLVQTEALNMLAATEVSAKTPEEKLEAAKKFAEVTIGLDNSLRKQGQAISAVNFFYKKSPLGIQIVENAKRQEDFNKWAEKKDKSWKEFFDDMMKEPEFEELIKEQVKEGMKKERAEARKARIEKVDKIFDTAINSFKGGATYSTIIPPKVITTALEGMKKAYHAGEKISELIEKAIDYISEELGGASWDKDKFRNEWAEKIKDMPEKRPLTDEEVKAKYLDRIRKKLVGLSERQKEDVILKAHKKIIDSGGLDFKDFRKIISDVTGRGEMSDAEAAKLRQLVSETNKVDEAGQKARETRTQAAMEEFHKAEVKAGAAARELNTLLSTRPNIAKRLTSLLQLNTLGFPALINNPIYNVWNHLGLRLPIGLVKTGIDQAIYGISKALGKEIKPETNILSVQVQKEFFKKLGLGTRESVGQFITGLNRMDYLNKEIQGDQIRPYTAFKDLWDYANNKRHLTKTQVIDKLIQVSPQGWVAEGIARTLNLGDKPMRFAADAAQAAAFAKSLGLKGIDFDLFIDFPREEAYRAYKAKGLSDAEAGKKADYIKDTIVKEGERSTFQQDNLLNNALSKGFEAIFGKNDGIADLAKATTVSPYLKIPINAYWSYFNTINPEVALMQSAMYGAKALMKSRGAKFGFDKSTSTAAKDVHEAKYWMAHAVVGFATKAVVASLVSAGIFRSGNTEKDTKKEREGEQNYEQQGSINVSKLWEYMKGGDPSKVKNGLVLQTKWFGQFGSIGNTMAKREEDMTDEQKASRDSYVAEMIDNIQQSFLPELEQGIFGNSSGLLSAMNMGGSFAQSWGVNTLNMYTNIIHPAAFAQWSKAQLPYYSKIKADTFKEELKNSMLQRSSWLRKLSGEYPPSKVGIWGDKIEKQGGTIQKLFGITKANDDNFAQPIYEDYKRTNDTRFFPSAVKPEVNNGNERIKLNSKEAARLEELVGQQRKQLLAPYINNMATFEGDDKKYKDIKDDEEKINNLKQVYEIGYERGKELFLNENKQYKVDSETESEKDEKEKEQTKQNKKLRKALRSK